MEFITIAKIPHKLFKVNNNIDYGNYKFYIFFIAFYTICFTTILMFNFWYNKPENVLQDKKTRRFVLYERKGFIATFIHWLFKLTILNLIFNFSNLIACLNLYENYYYTFFIASLVLFFDLWIGLRRVYKVTYFQLVFSFIIITSLSFGLSLSRPYNDNDFQKFIHKGNTKNIYLPKINLKQKNSFPNCAREIEVTEDSKIYLNGNLRDLKSLMPHVSSNGLHSIRLSSCLFIDKNTPMQTFNSLKNELRRADKLKVKIMLEAHNKCQDVNSSLLISFPPYSFQFLLKSDSILVGISIPPPPSNGYHYIEDSLIIPIQINENELLLMDSIIVLKDLNELMQSTNSEEKVYLIKYHNKTSFQKYIEVYNEIVNTINDQRDILSYQLVGCSYYDLKNKMISNDSKTEKYKKIHTQIRRKYPINIVEKTIK